MKATERRRTVNCSARIDLVLEDAPIVDSPFWLFRSSAEPIQPVYATLDCTGVLGVDGVEWTGSVIVGGPVIPAKMQDNLQVYGQALFTSDLREGWPGWVEKLFDVWRPR